MAYSSPRTWVSGELVTAALLNQEVRDNLLAAFPNAVGAWPGWAPTWTGFTVGNAVVDARYIKVGRSVWYAVRVTLGTTSAMGSSPTFTLPVALAARYSTAVPEAIGGGIIRDTGTANFQLVVAVSSLTTGALSTWNVAGTYATANALTATVPMAWTNGDEFGFSGFYEAAS